VCKWKVIHIQKLAIRYVTVYNPATADLIYRFKESLDEACYPIFFDQVQRKIKKRYRDYDVVLMPSSVEKTKQRGFVHLQKMIEPLGLKVVQDAVWKTADVKQATMNKANRSSIKDIIQVDLKRFNPSMKILLIDDVCTTGETLLAVFNLIRSYVLVIEAVVFAVHPECLKGVN
jgi:competence protein ComFC